MTHRPCELDGALAALGTRHGKLAQIRPALRRVGLHVVVEPIDTDAFGTFDGRVPRPDGPARVVAAKATAAAEAAGLRYGLASEGSFSPHPEVPIVTLDLELVALVDLQTSLVVVGRHQAPAPWAVPGVDLRAHRCPDRQPVIAAAAADLAVRLGRRCPTCGAPGVGVDRVEAGLPCAWCGAPTLDLFRTVDRCPGCGDEWVTEAEGVADPGRCPICNP